ncbi:MAG TPA: DUF2092 domain-containing protein [Chitinophagaceae bacterium]|jgi:hypothetical protein
MKYTSRRLYFLLVTLLVSIAANAQDKLIDSVAIRILDRMSNVIGDLKSCSLTVKTEYDSLDQELGYLKHLGESQLYFSGPNKMLVLPNGERGHRGFWYNGSKMAYYSFTNNHYGFMESPPGSTLETISLIHDKYGIDFPASDFFYPTFTDDLIASSDRIEYLGQVDMEGTNCFYVVAKSKDQSVQLWIRDDAFNLPAKMVIISKQGGNSREFEANYSGWMVNPDLPDAMFDFIPPPTATKLTIVPSK